MLEGLSQVERLRALVTLFDELLSARIEVQGSSGKVVVASAPLSLATHPPCEAPVVVGLVIAGRVLGWQRQAEAHPRLQAALDSIADFTAYLTIFSAEAGETQVAAARSEERLRIAMEATSDAIWDWDLETNKAFYSPRWFEMLGYTPGAFASDFDTWAAMTDPEDVARTRAIVQSAVARGQGYTTEFRMRHADGSWRLIRGRGKVTGRNASGRPTRMSGTNTDVTEQRESEAERAQLERALRQQEKMSAIGQLAGGVAHDFNNQLTTILGSAEVLREQVQDDPERLALIDEISAAAQRSAELTRKLLSFSRKSPSMRRTLDLNELVREVTPMLSRSIDPKVRIVTRLEAGSAKVMGDPAELQNAILNLALNARDAMPEGGTLTIATSNVDPGGADEGRPPELGPKAYVLVSVRDTGVGMSAEVMSRILEPFFTTKPEGTGMGLPSVYGTAKSHDGELMIRSKENYGSLFAIGLPAADEGSELYERIPSNIPLSPISTILIVDDEPSVRELFARVLKSLGHHVQMAASGAEAVEMVAKAPQAYDAAIVDLAMPGIGGRETISSLRQLAPNLKFMVTSGFASPDEVQATLTEGTRVFLPKPFTRAQLANALKEALER